MVQLLHMRQQPTGQVDHAVLGRLETALGAQRSREVIEDACFELIERLTRFEVAHVDLDAKEARRLARAVAAIAGEIGLTELADAARSAAQTQAHDDPTARAATAQRMMRVGEGSLDAVLSVSRGSGSPS